MGGPRPRCPSRGRRGVARARSAPADARRPVRTGDRVPRRSFGLFGGGATDIGAETSREAGRSRLGDLGRGDRSAHGSVVEARPGLLHGSVHLRRQPGDLPRPASPVDRLLARSRRRPLLADHQRRGNRVEGQRERRSRRKAPGSYRSARPIQGKASPIQAWSIGCCSFSMRARSSRRVETERWEARSFIAWHPHETNPASLDRTRCDDHNDRGCSHLPACHAGEARVPVWRRSSG